MDNFIYEEIGIGNGGRNVSHGLLMKDRIYASPRIEIHDSEAYGRCLYLDGSLQCSEFDEHIYHEVLAHLTLIHGSCYGRVLIIGGGDGGTLREVLKHKNISSVTLCEINPEVIEACKTHFPCTELDKSLKDPRVHLVMEDGVKFMENCLKQKLQWAWDCIIIDCPDPSPESRGLYAREFIRKTLAPQLAKGGSVAIQCGNIFTNESFVRGLNYELMRAFSKTRYAHATLPSHASGGIGFLIAYSQEGPISYKMFENFPTKYLNQANAPSCLLISPKSYQAGLRRVKYDWYCSNVFDFRRNRTRAEQTVINKFCQLEDEPADPQFLTMSFAQAVHKGTPVMHAVKFLTLDATDFVEKALEELQIERGIIPGHGINGVTFHSNPNVLELHYVMSVDKIAKDFPHLAKNKPDVCFDEAIVTQLHYEKKIVCGVTYSDLTRDYAVWESSDGVVTTEAVRVRNNLTHWRGTFTEPTREVVDKMGKADMMLSSVCRVKFDTYMLRFKA